MGLLEQRIVASLEKIRESEPDFAGSMLVFPTSLMSNIGDVCRDDCRTVEEEDVLMVSRASS